MGKLGKMGVVSTKVTCFIYQFNLYFVLHFVYVLYFVLIYISICNRKIGIRAEYYEKGGSGEKVLNIHR